MAEQLALQQLGLQTGAVDGDERLVAPRALIVDGAGEAGLAGAVFSEHEHVGEGGGDLARHGELAAEELAARGDGGGRRNDGRRRRSGRRGPGRDGSGRRPRVPGELGVGGVDIDGLEQAPGGAGGEGLLAALGAGGQHDHGQARGQPTQPGEQVGGVLAAHLPVEERDLEIAEVGEAGELGARTHGGGVVVRAGEAEGKKAAHPRLVANQEDVHGRRNGSGV